MTNKTEDRYSGERVCFVICPTGDTGSTTRRAVDGLIDSVIAPVLDGNGFHLDVAYRMSKTGSITNQVIEALLTADLVIADLTELNANVMYELAVRHCKRLPVIILARRGTELPFDVRDQRTIFFEDDPKGVHELREALQSAIPEAMVDKEPDNPVYRAAADVVMRTVGAPEPISYLVGRLDRLERSFVTMARSFDVVADYRRAYLRRAWTHADRLRNRGFGDQPVLSLLLILEGTREDAEVVASDFRGAFLEEPAIFNTAGDEWRISGPVDSESADEFLHRLIPAHADKKLRSTFTDFEGD